MKNAVLLAPYFLPRRRVGVWRPFKFAIHLKEFGWQPHIITIEAEGTLTDKEIRLLGDIPVYSIKPPFDFTDTSESSRTVSGESLQKGKKRPPCAAEFIDRHFPVDTWLPLFILRLKFVKKVVAGINPDLIWSTGDPWSGHWPAGKIAEEFHLPWVADFRDPWTLGKVNLKKRSKFSSFFDRRFEKKVVKKASVLTFTAKATEKLYRKHYRRYEPKTVTIYNSFDRDLYEQNEPAPARFDSSFLNLIFFGSFRELSPADSFIKVLEKLRKTDKKHSKLVRMYSFGRLNKTDSLKARQAGVLSQFKQLPAIPPEKALPFLKGADLLWLSTHPERKNIIPAKLWDYLAAKKPILSIAPNPEIGKILDQTGTGLQLDERRIEQAAAFLREALLKKQKGPESGSFCFFNPNEEQIATFDSTHATRRLALIFDNLV